ncbi:MAG: HDOD domain-containing protein [Archangium sp.]|nr:HDOD domain-containing protein [Archangium sp.]
MKTRVDQILACAAALRPFPKVAQRALALLDDPLVSAGKLVEVVSLDAAVTAAVLKGANSASLARTRQVNDLKQALALLGNARFRELVFASAAVPFLSARNAGYQLPAGELWRHSVATGLLAQQLAQLAKLDAGPMLFTAGLLHDLGKAVLGQFVEAGANEIQSLVSGGGRSFLEAELEVLGMHHAELGARIAERWNFSPELVELIRFHHEPDARPHSKPLAALHVANVLTQLSGVSTGIDGLGQRGHEESVKLLGLTRKDLEASLADQYSRLLQAETLLGMGSQAA